MLAFTLLFLTLIIPLVMTAATIYGTLCNALVVNDSKVVALLAPVASQEDLEMVMEMVPLCKFNAESFFVLVQYIDDKIAIIHNMCHAGRHIKDAAIKCIRNCTSIRDKILALEGMLDDYEHRDIFIPLIMAIDKPYLILGIKAASQKHRWDVCEMLVRKSTGIVSAADPAGILITAARAKHTMLFMELAKYIDPVTKARAMKGISECAYLGRLHRSLRSEQEIMEYLRHTWKSLVRNKHYIGMMSCFGPTVLNGILRGLIKTCS